MVLSSLVHQPLPSFWKAPEVTDSQLPILVAPPGPDLTAQSRRSTKFDPGSCWIDWIWTPKRSLLPRNLPSWTHPITCEVLPVKPPNQAMTVRSERAQSTIPQTLVRTNACSPSNELMVVNTEDLTALLGIGVNPSQPIIDLNSHGVNPYQPSISPTKVLLIPNYASTALRSTPGQAPPRPGSGACRPRPVDDATARPGRSPTS